MARVVHPYANGAGKPLNVTIDVTPSWWKNKRTGAYAAVAQRTEKGFFCLTALNLSVVSITVQTFLLKDQSIEDRLIEFMAVLEELGSEWSRPPLEDDAKA